MIIASKFAAINILYQLAAARNLSMNLETIARNRIHDLTHEIIGLVNDQYDTKFESMRNIRKKYLGSEINSLLDATCDEEVFAFLKSLFLQYELTNTPAVTSGIKQQLFSLNPSPGSVITFYLNSKFSAPDKSDRETDTKSTIDMIFMDGEWKISRFNIN